MGRLFARGNRLAFADGPTLEPFHLLGQRYVHRMVITVKRLGIGRVAI